jgi:hypothetical protein
MKLCISTEASVGAHECARTDLGCDASKGGTPPGSEQDRAWQAHGSKEVHLARRFS